jgi:hypothetical protein
MTRNCNFCNRPYKADPRNLKRGWGLCCSKSCAASLREQPKINMQKQLNEWPAVLTQAVSLLEGYKDHLHDNRIPVTKSYAELLQGTIHDVGDIVDFLKTQQPLEGTKTFEGELSILINRYSLENGSNTPDFILGMYLTVCLNNWNQAVKAREQWHGRGHEFPSGAIMPDSLPTKQTEEGAEAVVRKGGDQTAKKWDNKEDPKKATILDESGFFFYYENMEIGWCRMMGDQPWFLRRNDQGWYTVRAVRQTDVWNANASRVEDEAINAEMRETVKGLA